MQSLRRRKPCRPRRHKLVFPWFVDLCMSDRFLTAKMTCRRPKLAACLLALALLSSSSISVAAAGCTPPAGMGIQQWYSICANALQQAYSEGMGQGLPYDAFVQSMFQVYAQPVIGAGGGDGYGGGGYGGGGGGAMLCQPGSMQCFNGYVRTCQGMATGGSWWITSARRC
jgi:hypothetical protein